MRDKGNTSIPVSTPIPVSGTEVGVKGEINTQGFMKRIDYGSLR